MNLIPFFFKVCFKEILKCNGSHPLSLLLSRTLELFSSNTIYFSGLSHSWTLSTCLRQITRLDIASWRRKWLWNHLENSQKTWHMWRERLQNIGTYCYIYLHRYMILLELNLISQILREKNPYLSISLSFQTIQRIIL